MMRRKLDSSLDVWVRSSHRKPLVLFGARGVGKTALLESLAQRSGRSLLRVDFSANPQAHEVFENVSDPHEITRSLAALQHADINPTRTLLFLDEIQRCDDALMSLRRFKTDMPELPVAAAGSSLGVHLAHGAHGVLPTNHVDTETVHPLDFEEFCWALGEGPSYEIAVECAEQMRPCPIHESMLSVYREYLLVGGMPETVERYRKSRSIDAARATQQLIRMLYTATMAEDSEGVDAAKIAATWNSLPAQLAKSTGSTKFMWKYIARGAKAERYAPALEWLQQAGFVNLCTQVSGATASGAKHAAGGAASVAASAVAGEPADAAINVMANTAAHTATTATTAMSGLRAYENPSSFKAYVADTGLLARAYNATLSDIFDGRSPEWSESQGRPGRPGRKSGQGGAGYSSGQVGLAGLASSASSVGPSGLATQGRQNSSAPYHQALFRAGIAENFVMQELVAAGESPHYWGMRSKHEAQFVVETPQGAVPIDVAVGRKHSRVTAARDFAARYESPFVVQVSERNIERTVRDGCEIRFVPPYVLTRAIA